MNTIRKHLKLWKQLDKEQSKYHRHKDGATGASSLAGWMSNDCGLEYIIKRCNFPDTPVKTGLKAWKGQAICGNMWHDKLETDAILNRKLDDDPIVINEIYRPILLCNETKPQVMAQLVEEDSNVVRFFEDTTLVWDWKAIENSLNQLPPFKMDDPRIDAVFTNDHVITRKKTFSDLLCERPELFKSIGYEVIVSPMDTAHVKNNGNPFEFRTYEFRDGTKAILPFATEDTVFERIIDIKSASPYKFDKYENSEISLNQKCQFTAYMMMARLRKLTVLYAHRDKGFLGEFDVHYGTKVNNCACIKEDFWDKMIKIRERFKSMMAKLKQAASSYEELSKLKLHLHDSYCACLRGDDSFTNYCSLNESKEEDGHWGKVVEQTAPCPFVKRIIVDRAKEKFEPCEEFKWARGNSHVKINEVKGGDVYAENKSGTKYVDSLSVAFKKYSLLEVN